MAEKKRDSRKAIRIEPDLYYQAVSLSGDTRDGNPTALVRRLIREEIRRAEEREKAEGKP